MIRVWPKKTRRYYSPRLARSEWRRKLHPSFVDWCCFCESNPSLALHVLDDTTGTTANLLREIESLGALMMGTGFEERAEEEIFRDPDDLRVPGDAGTKTAEDARWNVERRRGKEKSLNAFRQLRDKPRLKRQWTSPKKRIGINARNAAFMEILRARVLPWMEGNVFIFPDDPNQPD